MKRLSDGIIFLRIFILSTLLLMSFCIHAQSWHKQVIRGEVNISFPVVPEHKIIDDKGNEAYLSQKDGCRFMVGISPNLIEDYSNYSQMAEKERISKALHTLEGVANGKINSKEQHLISMKSFQSGKNVGLDIEYATLEPSNVESRKRFSTLLLVKNTLYIFDCWYMDGNDHHEDKEKFFGSILIKGN